MAASFTVAGHLCVDLTPILPDQPDLTPGALQNIGSMRITVGGSLANTAKVLRALGAEVSPSGVVGEDELGRITKQLLAAEGLDTSSVLSLPDSSSSYSIVLEPRGKDRTFWHHVGANALFGEHHINFSHDIVHIGYLSLLPALFADKGSQIQGIIKRARETGAVLSLDLAVVDQNSEAGQVNWADLFKEIGPAIDILTPSIDDVTSALQLSEPFSPELHQNLAQQFIDWGVGIVALSAGKEGMVLRTGSLERLQNSPLEKLIDTKEWAEVGLVQESLVSGEPVSTNGAGDASTAGFLFAMSRGASPHQANLAAAATSATVIAGKKASPAEIVKLVPELSPIFEEPSGYSQDRTS